MGWSLFCCRAFPCVAQNSRMSFVMAGTSTNRTSHSTDSCEVKHHYSAVFHDHDSGRFHQQRDLGNQNLFFSSKVLSSIHNRQTSSFEVRTLKFTDRRVSLLSYQVCMCKLIGWCEGMWSNTMLWCCLPDTCFSGRKTTEFCAHVDAIFSISSQYTAT